jgi:uncharacterized membrane protein YuzA (DUF378 family)
MKKRRIKPLLQEYRLSVIAVFVMSSLIWIKGLFQFDLIEFIIGSEKYGFISSDVYLIVGIMVALGLFLNKYLSTEDQNNTRTNINIENSGSHENIVNLMANAESKFNDEINIIKESLKKTHDEIQRKAGDSLDNEQREELIVTLKEQLIEASSEKLIEDLRDKTNQIISRDTSLRLESHFSRTIKRLTEEIHALGKRSKVNLIIGSLTAFAGVSIFMLFVLERSGDVTSQAYLVKEFAPRISLVIVIEIFAYFFLGLYKSNLSEIKHFHNELTNVEQRHMALEEAVASADVETVKEIVKDIAKTERNFLLKKGESTVTLEDRRLTLEEQNGIINALLSKVGSNGK